MLGTKMGPHMQTSQTRSPGASEKAPCPHLPVQVWRLWGGHDILRSLKRAETQSAFSLSNMGQQRELTLGVQITTTTVESGPIFNYTGNCGNSHTGTLSMRSEG